jgi:nicotinamide-nucleotide amidase
VDAQTVVSRLTEAGMTLALAESCTGGYIAHLITNVPGASRVFVGGVVAYDNRAKMALLGLSPDLLSTYGSVSPEAAIAMAERVRERLDADIGVGITGIAGPGGGSEGKPVGTVYLALAGRDGRSVALRAHFPGSREEYKARTADLALRMIEEYLAETAAARDS